jgi:hypothetical protein
MKRILSAYFSFFSLSKNNFPYPMKSRVSDEYVGLYNTNKIFCIKKCQIMFEEKWLSACALGICDSFLLIFLVFDCLGHQHGS